MKKFYDLIEPMATREICKETNHKLTTLDCILLVKMNNKLTLEEKHNLYTEIISSMPEEKIPAKLLRETPTKLTLFELLKDHMKKENEEIKRFLNDAEEAVYENLFLDKRPLKKLIKDIIEHGEECYFIENTKTSINADFSKDGKIISISAYTEFDNVFSNCAPKLPMPYKKGDLLTHSNYGDTKLCVFDEEVKSEKDGIIGYANVYYYNKANSHIHREQLPISELDYYDNKISQELIIYKLLSEYMKGKIELDVLLNAYSLNIQRKSLSETEEYFYWQYCSSKSAKKYIKNFFEN